MDRTYIRKFSSRAEQKAEVRSPPESTGDILELYDNLFAGCPRSRF